MDNLKTEIPHGKETSVIRKGYKIHFISRNEVEVIESTKNAGNIYVGELTTNKNEYSVDFIQRWRKSGFLKIYKS